ncbi:MAG: hypothetical protein BM563_04025 [Bacteroidetes bacterium MedPE-SWsnd-G1]|nr:MAG: hypothetical protein BM563_04025 [Bacteroidetes bacterium MedPE-SWsnd-G1]
MKNTMTLFVFLVLCSSILSFGQGFQGKATYQTKTTMDLNLEGSNIPLDQQERIKERMKSRLEKVFELSFNSTESIYKEEEQLDRPGQGGRGMRFGGFGAGKNYKNIKDQQYTQEQNLMGKEFLVKDELEKLEWEFLDESKVVGKHLCFKAVAKKMAPNVEAFRFGRGRGGNNNDTSEKPKDSLKEIEVVAWYTPDIPVSHGPDSYWGLPGLILEINADNTQIVCTKIVLNPKEKAEIKMPKKGEVVTAEEYREISIKKMKEMREMYGNERRGGGRPSRN